MSSLIAREKKRSMQNTKDNPAPTAQQLQMMQQQFEAKQKEARLQKRIIALDLASKSKKDTDTPADVLSFADKYFSWINAEDAE